MEQATFLNVTHFGTDFSRQGKIEDFFQNSWRHFELRYVVLIIFFYLLEQMDTTPIQYVQKVHGDKIFVFFICTLNQYSTCST
jgi:hypothetical protein